MSQQSAFAHLPDTLESEGPETLVSVGAMSIKAVQAELCEVSGTAWRFPEDGERRRELWRRIDQAARAGRLESDRRTVKKAPEMSKPQAPDLQQRLRDAGSYHSIDWAAWDADVARHQKGRR